MKKLKWLGIVIVVLLFLVLIVPILIPIPPLEGVVPAEKLANPDSLFIDLNGIRVHYKITGKGEPTLILLHGFGASLFSWHEVMQPLTAYGTVISYDRPAFGLTERPMPGEWQGINPYSVSGNVEMLVALMDALKIPKAILIGNSAGGGVSVAMALAHPERVQALILVDAAIYGNFSGPWFASLLNTPQVNHLGPLLVRSISESGMKTLYTAWHDPSKVTDDTIAGYRLPLKVENWDRALWEFQRAAENLDLGSHLGEIKLPVLVVSGDDDRIIPSENSVRISKAISGAELVIFKDCGHVPHEECPQLFLEAVANFMLQFLDKE